MMTTPKTGPTAEELQEFGNVEDWEEVELETTEFAGGGPVVMFTWEELDDLLAACKIVDEDSIAFVRRAALDRVAEVLQRHRSDTSAAS